MATTRYVVTVPEQYQTVVPSHVAACSLVTWWASRGVHATFRTVAAR